MIFGKIFAVTKVLVKFALLKKAAIASNSPGGGIGRRVGLKHQW